MKAYFDDAVAVSEEASVALYSFGDAALLEKATREVVQLVESWGLFSRQRDVLDFGCGTGRFEVLIAPLVRHIVGIDISTAMIAAARRNSAAWPQVTCFPTNGLDLRAIPDASFDLALAVDSMPYVVAAGAQLTNTHFAEFARVLRPGGETRDRWLFVPQKQRARSRRGGSSSVASSISSPRRRHALFSGVERPRLPPCAALM